MLGLLECRVRGHELEGRSPGLHQYLDIPEEFRYFEVRHPALATPKERTFAPDSEVHLREFETVLVLTQGFEPLERVLRLRVSDEKALRRVETATDPAAQLMQLREPEPFCTLYNDRARVWH